MIRGQTIQVSRQMIRSIGKHLRNFAISMPDLDNSGLNVQVLGSAYGKKGIILPDKPMNIISAGVGDDISFESELLVKGEVRICLIDPTELSAKIFKQLNGSRDFTSLESKRKNLVFLNYALWVTNGKVTLYPPKSPQSNDFSIGNLQNVDRVNGIEFPCITIASVLAVTGWVKIDFLKLDIEGAVLEVLIDMFEQDILPDQIAIEVDELFFLSIRNLLRARAIFRLLNKKGYYCVYHHYFDFTFKKKIF